MTYRYMIIILQQLTLMKQSSLSYSQKLLAVKKLKKNSSSFLRYSQDRQKWEATAVIANPDPAPLTQIRTLSFNVLYDRLHRIDRRGNMEHVLNSKDRFKFILEEIGKMDPTIVGLQEVTIEFWRMLVQCQWAKQKYWITDFKEKHMHFGNILMSKIQPICLEPVKVERLPRMVWTGFFSIQPENWKEPQIVGFSSVHLIALDKNHEVRRHELANLISQLNPYRQIVTDLVFQGDMNFHAEFETQNATKHGLKDAWLEKYENVKQHPGYTFDSQSNGLINEMYWGFERRRMRLDRIFYYGTLFTTKDIQIVFTHPVHGQKQEVDNHFFLKGAFLFVADYFGWKMRSDRPFLYASDHFGLLATLMIKQQLH